jgi:outer membrane protein
MTICRLLLLALLFLPYFPDGAFAEVRIGLAGQPELSLVKETADDPSAQPAETGAMTESIPATSPQNTAAAVGTLQATTADTPEVNEQPKKVASVVESPTVEIHPAVQTTSASVSGESTSQLSNVSAAPGISLRQAEKIALENNLNLLAETYNTRASKALVDRGRGIYDPTLRFELLSGQQKDQINSQSLPSLTPSQLDTISLTSGVTQKLPSGADLSLSFNNTRADIDSIAAPPLNPEHNSDVTLAIVQPLLQGFGKTVTEQEILLSQKDRESSVEDLRSEVFNLLAAVRNAYYETLRTRDDLAFREASVRVAEQVLKENQARVEVGVLPKVELLEAEVGLKTRQRDLLDADRVYRNALDQLALLLNSETPLQPSINLEQQEITLDEEAGFSTSLVYRPDLQRRLHELERIDLERTLSRDQLKPNLDLLASYGRQGIGDGFGDSLSGLNEDDLHAWQLGLSFSYPLGNRAARSDLQRNQVRLKGKRAELQQLKAEIRTEVRLAIRQVKVASSKIEVSKSERALAKEKLEILLGRKAVGLATTRDVLEGEQDLASAQSELVTALADYNKATTEYLRVTGQLLEHEGVRLAGDLEANADGPAFSLD